MSFHSLGDGLRNLVSDWAEDDEFRWRLIARAWRSAAGDAVGERAAAESWSDGELMVRVADRRWAATLQELEPELLAGIRRRPGGDLVRRIRWVFDDEDDPGAGS